MQVHPTTLKCTPSHHLIPLEHVQASHYSMGATIFKVSLVAALTITLFSITGPFVGGCFLGACILMQIGFSAVKSVKNSNESNNPLTTIIQTPVLPRAEGAPVNQTVQTTTTSDSPTSIMQRIQGLLNELVPDETDQEEYLDYIQKGMTDDLRWLFPAGEEQTRIDQLIEMVHQKRDEEIERLLGTCEELDAIKRIAREQNGVCSLSEKALLTLIEENRYLQVNGSIFDIDYFTISSINLGFINPCDRQPLQESTIQAIGHHYHISEALWLEITHTPVEPRPQNALQPRRHPLIKFLQRISYEQYQRIRESEIPIDHALFPHRIV